MSNKTGYQCYVEKFGKAFDAFKELPAQISPSNWREPDAVESDPCLDDLFRECAKNGRPFTAHDVVDAVYLSAEGVYSFDDVETRDYADFIRKVSALKIFR